MKHILTTLVLCIGLSAPAMAQAPSAMNYQGVARDASGALLQNTDLSLRLSILRGSADGERVYSETHRVRTDAAGQFSLRLGEGENPTDDFSMIEWYNEYFWLRVEMDERGGSDYALLGTSQLLSVPYAFYAVQAGSLAPSNLDAAPIGKPSQVWHLTGNRGTDPSQDFIGTTDDVDLVIRTDNVERLRLTSSGSMGLGTSTPQSALDVNDNITVGGTYAGTYAAPVNGAIIEGQTGIGTYNPAGKLTVKGQGSDGTIRVWPETSNHETSIGLYSDPAGTTTPWIMGHGSWNNAGDFIIGHSTPKILVQQDGKVGIGRTNPEYLLDVNGDVMIRGHIDITGNTNIGGTLDVGETVTAHSDLDVEGILTVKDQTNSTSKDNGSMVLEGGAGIEKNLHVGKDLEVGEDAHILGNAIIDGTLDVKGKSTFGLFEVSAQGNLTFNSQLDDGKHHVALFGNSADDNDADGIAVKVGKTGTNRGSNNYITFYDGDNDIVGRIEGYDFYEDWENPPPPPTTADIDMTEVFTLPFSSTEVEIFGGTGLSVPGVGSISVPRLAVDIPTGIDFGKMGFHPDKAYENSYYTKLDALIEWAVATDNTDLIVTSPLELVIQGVLFAKKNEYLHGGVKYQSHGADYAEWLPKSHPSEHFLPGQIVGIKDGKVTRDISNADHIMAVSMNPVVVGNMPKQNDKSSQVPIAFMGQVPVYVLGEAHAGDYIIARENGKGTGFAVPPNELHSNHLPFLLGTALEDSNNNSMSMVNVLIGVRTNAASAVLQSQNDRIEKLEARMDEYRRTLAESNAARMESLEAENRMLREEIRTIRTALGLPENSGNAREVKLVNNE